MSPNIVSQKSFARKGSFGGWGNFYAGSNQLLQPYEIFDCFRNPGNTVWHTVFENRYFYDPTHDNFVVFLLAWGHLSPLHGRINMSDAIGMPVPEFNHSNSLPTVWETTEWDELISRIFLDFNETFRPTHVQLNYGHHPTNFTDGRRERLVNALNSSSMTSIWRTISHDRDRQRPEGSDDEDNVMCDLLDNCLNISWWQRLPTYLYQDNLHPIEPAYRSVNEELLEMVGHVFPNGYDRAKRSGWR